MKPFVLRAHLRSPIIRRGFVTLDALLMATLERGDASDLLRCDRDLYLASAGFCVDAVATQNASFVASMRPQNSEHWLDLLKPNTQGAADLQIGVQRQEQAGNIIKSYTATVACAIEWYATGHAEAVLAVMQPVRFIGKKRTAGYGEVSRWEVEDGQLDGLVGYAGEPLRPVPTDRWTEGGDWIPMEAAWKAPYWDVRNRDRCFVPMEV